jgi:hypothetical protein
MAAGSVQNAFTKPVLLHSDRYQPVTFAVIHRSGHNLASPSACRPQVPHELQISPDRRPSGVLACGLLLGGRGDQGMGSRVCFSSLNRGSVLNEEACPSRCRVRRLGARDGYRAVGAGDVHPTSGATFNDPTGSRGEQPVLMDQITEAVTFRQDRSSVSWRTPWYQQVEEQTYTLVGNKTIYDANVDGPLRTSHHCCQHNRRCRQRWRWPLTT